MTLRSDRLTFWYPGIFSLCTAMSWSKWDLDFSASIEIG